MLLQSRRAWLLALDRAAAACGHQAGLCSMHHLTLAAAHSPKHALLSIERQEPAASSSCLPACSLHCTDPQGPLRSAMHFAAALPLTHAGNSALLPSRCMALAADQAAAAGISRPQGVRRFHTSRSVLAVTPGWSDDESSDEDERDAGRRDGGGQQSDEEDYTFEKLEIQSYHDMPHYMSHYPIGDMDEEEVGKYVYFGQDVAPPEAFQDWHVDPRLIKEKIIPYRAGCTGMQDEFAFSDDFFLMFRERVFDLFCTVANRARPLVKVDGPAAWARANDFIVLYVPSAYKMLFDSDFMVNDEGICDTPDTAKQLLRSMHDAHAKQLKELDGPQAQQLLATLEAGLAGQQPHEPVDALISVIEQLRDFEEAKVLVAIDDYNTLWLNSEYLRFVPGRDNDHFAEPVPGRDVRAAAALRLLNGRPPINGSFVCALSKSQRVSPKLRIPKRRCGEVILVDPDTEEKKKRRLPVYTMFEMNEFSLAEMRTMVQYYSDMGTPFAYDSDGGEEFDEMFLQAYHISQGCPRVFRNKMMWGIYGHTYEGGKKRYKQRI